MIFRSLFLVSCLVTITVKVEAVTAAPPKVDARVVDVLNLDGQAFRDLNGNGQVDGYEDWRLPVPERVNDLVPRMTLQ
jgi:beta-glucosidase